MNRAQVVQMCCRRVVWMAGLPLLLACVGCPEQAPPPASNDESGNVGVNGVHYTDKTPEEWLKLMRSANPQVRDRAIDAILLYGPDQVPALAAMLKDPKAGPGRLAAARALGAFGTKARSAVPALTAMMEDASDPYRDAAAEALGEVGAGDPQAVAALQRAAEDEDPLMRMTALRALRRLGADDEKTVRCFAAALEDADVNVQMAALEGLRRLGAKAAPARSALEKAAQSPNPLIGEPAKEILKSLP
ncbi:hypothetical protein JCM19992_04490 [Thermostilla marina]